MTFSPGERNWKWSRIWRSPLFFPPFQSLSNGIKLLTRSAHNCGHREPLFIVVFWLADPVNGDSGVTGAGGPTAATPVALQGAAAREASCTKSNECTTCWVTEAHVWRCFDMDEVSDYLRRAVMCLRHFCQIEFYAKKMSLSFSKGPFNIRYAWKETSLPPKLFFKCTISLLKWLPDLKKKKIRIQYLIWATRFWSFKNPMSHTF